MSRLEDIIAEGKLDSELISEIEASILVSSVDNVNVAYTVSKQLEPSHFSNSEIGRAWAVVSEFLEAGKGKNINLATIQVELNRRDIGFDLSKYVSLTTQDEDVIHAYCELVKKLYFSWYLGNELSSIDVQNVDIIANLDKLKSLANEIENNLLDVSETVHISELADEIDEYLSNDEKPIIYGLGLPGVDEQIIDLAPGNTAIISASPSVGKTSLGIHMAVKNALKGVPVHFFSLEMSRRQLSARILNALVGVSAKNILSKKVDKTGLRKLKGAKHILDKLPLYLSPHPDMPLHTLLQSIRDSKLKNNTQIFIIDYIQLVDVTGRTKREEASLVAQRLKSIALELDVCILFMSQLKRIDSSKNEPDMFDLKETSDLEQSASFIAIMYPDKTGFFDKYKTETETPIFFKVDKQRNGEKFKKLISFNATEMSFSTIMSADMSGYEDRSKGKKSGESKGKDSEDDGTW